PQQERRVERVGDVVYLGQVDPGLAQAVVDGVEGQFPGGERDRTLAVLDPGEALLLRGGNHPAVRDQAGSRVVVDGVDAERVHRASLRAPAPLIRTLLAALL